jgi:hypothetical protein
MIRNVGASSDVSIAASGNCRAVSIAAHLQLRVRIQRASAVPALCQSRRFGKNRAFAMSTPWRSRRFGDCGVVAAG